MKPEENPLADLLDNIDKLTKPNTRKELQETVAGQPMKVVRLTLPALLTQLDEAIRGTIGIGGSASLPNERNMLDAEALYRSLLLKSQIAEWARDVKADVKPNDPAATLRAWYVKWVEKPRENGHVKSFVSRTQNWIEQIEAILDPPRIRELPDRCPECEAFYWWNPRDKHKYAHPLIIEYKLSDGASMVEEASGKCRACETEWGARQLAFELEQQYARDVEEAFAVQILLDWADALEYDTLRNLHDELALGTTTV